MAGHTKADRGYFSNPGAGPNHRAGAFYGNGPERRPDFRSQSRRGHEHHDYYSDYRERKPYHRYHQRERYAYGGDFDIYRRERAAEDKSSSRPRTAYNPNYLGRDLSKGDSTP